jgi:solute carrier family 10 (sodium/bile acid cotransporter), member 7
MTRSAKQRISFQSAGIGVFLLLIFVVIFLAWVRPAWGVSNHNNAISLEKISTYGVSVIFFFYGLSLSARKLWDGLADWRMHVVVQAATFIVFPILLLSMKSLAVSLGIEMIWLGVFYLSALPSTVSSSVVMVSLAGGNIPSAIFNASISSLLGIFMTPFWMGLISTPNSSGTMDVSSVISKLIIQVFLPVVLGMILHSKWGGFAVKNKSRLKFFDQSVILLIIFTSFCRSFYDHVFDNLTMLELILLTLSMIVLFFVVFGLLSLISKVLRFNREDRITVLFCGSKKSLVHGTVMSKVLFGPTAPVGIILLPLMLYHALQLMIASILAQQMAAKDVETNTVSQPVSRK